MCCYIAADTLRIKLELESFLHIYADDGVITLINDLAKSGKYFLVFFGAFQIVSKSFDTKRKLTAFWRGCDERCTCEFDAFVVVFTFAQRKPFAFWGGCGERCTRLSWFCKFDALVLASTSARYLKRNIVQLMQNKIQF